MKTFLVILLLAFSVPPFTGCANFTTPTAVVTPAEATTLRAAALAASTTMRGAAQALKLGKITVAQWRALEKFHDEKFQVAFNIALKAAMSDLSPAGPDLFAILGEFTALAVSFNH